MTAYVGDYKLLGHILMNLQDRVDVVDVMVSLHGQIMYHTRYACVHDNFSIHA